ncbi:MAG: hypothetical protein ACR2M4_11375, partial [Actinomycetota bacterium]
TNGVACGPVTGSYSRTHGEVTVKATHACTVTATSGATTISATETMTQTSTGLYDTCSGGGPPTGCTYKGTFRTHGTDPAPPPPPTCGEKSVTDDGPTGMEVEGGCSKDDVDGDQVNNSMGNVPHSAPLSTIQLAQMFGIPAATLGSTKSSTDSGPTDLGFSTGGCPSPGGTDATCSGIRLKWRRLLTIDQCRGHIDGRRVPCTDSTRGSDRLYFGAENKSWLIPSSRPTDNRTYDWLADETEVNAVGSRFDACSIKVNLKQSGGTPSGLRIFPAM